MELTTDIDATLSFPIISLRQSKSVVYTGDLGGATVTIMCHGVPLTDGVLTDNSQIIINHGYDAPIQAVVAGITTPITLFVYSAW